MTKSQLVERLAAETNIPKVRAERLVNSVLEAMKEAMKRGERIELRGFGVFEMREYGPYNARNPATGEAVHAKRKRLPFFKCGKELKALINT